MVSSPAWETDGGGQISMETAMAELCSVAGLQGGGGRSGECQAMRMADRRAARQGRPPGGLGWLRLVLMAANRVVALWRGGAS
jgi:hypothetical protein